MGFYAFFFFGHQLCNWNYFNNDKKESPTNNSAESKQTKFLINSSFNFIYCELKSIICSTHLKRIFCKIKLTSVHIPFKRNKRKIWIILCVFQYWVILIYVFTTMTNSVLFVFFYWFLLRRRKKLLGLKLHYRYI